MLWVRAKCLLANHARPAGAVRAAELIGREGWRPTWRPPRPWRAEPPARPRGARWARAGGCAVGFGRSVFCGRREGGLAAHVVVARLGMPHAPDPRKNMAVVCSRPSGLAPPPGPRAWRAPAVPPNPTDIQKPPNSPTPRPSPPAGHVVQAGVVEERHAGGVPPVLAADAQLDAGPRRAAALRRDAHELAHADSVEGLKGVGRQDAVLDVVPAAGRGRRGARRQPAGVDAAGGWGRARACGTDRARGVSSATGDPCLCKKQQLQQLKAAGTPGRGPAWWPTPGIWPARRRGKFPWWSG